MQLPYPLSRTQRVRLLAFVCAGLALATTIAVVLPPPRRAMPVRYGAAVPVGPLRDDPQFRALLAREVSILTPEVAMKWEVVQPERNRYDFDGADTLVQFAESHHMQVRGHTLVWHEQLPRWLTRRVYRPEQVRALLRDYITQVVGRYRGQVVAWDVVNEAVADDGTLRRSFWLKNIGPEYIELAFRWAHEADPEALLFYNDYGAETPGRKADAVYELVRDLVARGVPIHGVGVQAHLSIAYPPSQAQLEAVLARLAGLGLRADITELDVRTNNGTGTPAQRAEAQAAVYRDVARACVATPSCQALITWGITDRYTWIPEYTGQPDTPLPFDRNMQPKPFYHELRAILGLPPSMLDAP